MTDLLTFIDILKKDKVLLELPATENDDAIEELGRGKGNTKLNQRFNKCFWTMH
jgi:hypothetical protein